jgi:hypothetical protein
METLNPSVEVGTFSWQDLGLNTSVLEYRLELFTEIRVAIHKYILGIFEKPVRRIS